MQVVADLHLHSKYSRAVSKNMVPRQIATWAAKKGIDLAATGDWTHPLYFRQLQTELTEAGEGVFMLKNAGPVGSSSRHPLFLLSTELSCIYSQGGRLRRIHVLVFAPSFEVVGRINDV